MKKRFLNYMLLLVAACLLFVSCKKEKNEPGYSGYISFKMDGVQKTFKAKAWALKVSLADVYSISCKAFPDTTSKEFIYIVISQYKKPIIADTYVDPGPDTRDLVVYASYMPASKDPVKKLFGGLQKLDDINPRLQVNISSLSEKTVTGAFSGTLYENAGDGPGKVAITEGKFDLPLFFN